MTKTFKEIEKRIVLQGNIIHTIVLEGVAKAVEEYPEEIDWILDFMNTEGYKQLKGIDERDKNLKEKYC